LKHVKAAVRESEFSDLPWLRSPAPLAYALGGLAIGGVIGVALIAAYQALFVPIAPVSAPLASSTADPAVLAAQTAGNVTMAPPAPDIAPPAKAVVAPGKGSIAAATRQTGESGAAPAPALVGGTASLDPNNLESPEGDILEQRLRATEQWLEEQSGTTYSIQLLGAGNPQLLRDYFKTIAKYLEIEKVYVYRTMANQRPSLTVLYGNFTNRAEVNRTLENLPDEMKINRPYYRTIRGVRSEIAKHRT
jgi:septal ring-binding cell division protein DamX